MIDVIGGLIGEEVNAVCFVMDYVEIRFNGPIVRCIADPSIQDDDGVWAFPGRGSRDALCRLIGADLSGVDAVEGRELKLSFSSGTVVSVPLDAASRHAGEAVHFVPGPNQSISVW